MPNPLNRKVLLRIPEKLALRIRKNGKGDEKINVKIRCAVDKFFGEVIPVNFRKDFMDLSPRELQFGPYLAREMGFFRSSAVPMTKRVCFGTILDVETLDRLKVIATWSGTSRQSAVDASLAYFMQIPGAPNPDRGQFFNFTHPLLSAPDRLTRHRLRWITEYAHL